MHLENRVLSKSRPTRERWLTWLSELFGEKLASDEYPLRYSIVDASGEQVLVEVTVLNLASSGLASSLSRDDALYIPAPRVEHSESFDVVQIIPTGIRCALGGYAGDATPVTNLLSLVADRLITHPNAVNASDINEMRPNVWYVEGGALDDFLLGRIELDRRRANRIGTLIDPTGVSHTEQVVHAMNAGIAVAGIASDLYTTRVRDFGVEIAWSPSGSAGGTVKHPEEILAGCRALLDAGADAIGVVSVIHGVTKSMSRAHIQGEIPNPSGAVEAIITRLISNVCRVPTAHAPLPYYSDIKHQSVENPRASAEFISFPHYFCVLKGLHRAPRPRVIDRKIGHVNGRMVGGLSAATANLATIDTVAAIVAPATALGGIPALAAEYHGIPVIAVRENHTILDVTAAHLGLANVIECESYLEASAILLAMKHGISLASLRRPLNLPRLLVEAGELLPRDQTRSTTDTSRSLLAARDRERGPSAKLVVADLDDEAEDDLAPDNPIARSSREFIEQLPTSTRAELEALVGGQHYARDGFPRRFFDELNQLKIVKSVVAEDGFSPEERMGLSALIEKLQLPPPVHDHILTFDVTNITNAHAVELVQPGSPRARALVNDALLVASLDGLSTRERVTIRELGRELQLDSAHVESLILSFGGAQAQDEEPAPPPARGGLTATIIDGAKIDPVTLEGLWRVFCDVCEFKRGADIEVARRTFEQGIRDAPNLCVLRDTQGTPQGMWLIRESVFENDGEQCILFNGDQWWVRKAYRGDPAIILSILRYASGVLRRQWRSRWFLVGTCMPSSYIFMKRWLDTVWALQHPDIPRRERQLLNAYAEKFFDEKWDHERQLYCTTIVRPRPLPAYIREREDTRQALEEYERFNPDWPDGLLLLCISEVNLRMLRRMLLNGMIGRMLKARIRRA